MHLERITQQYESFAKLGSLRWHKKTNRIFISEGLKKILNIYDVSSLNDLNKYWTKLHPGDTHCCKMLLAKIKDDLLPLTENLRIIHEDNTEVFLKVFIEREEPGNDWITVVVQDVTVDATTKIDTRNTDVLLKSILDVSAQSIVFLRP